MLETWLPTVDRRDGPAHKTGYDFDTSCEGAGAVVHSAEGSLEAAFGVLDGPRQASWHFTVAQDGRCFQHYPLEAACWHAGNMQANLRYFGIENEGVAGEPLTALQIATLRGLLLELRNLRGWGPLQRDVNLFEHNQFYATACPSGRIPWEQLLAGAAPPDVSVERMLDALQAATATVWTHQDFKHVPPWDLEVLRHLVDGG